MGPKKNSKPLVPLFKDGVGTTAAFCSWGKGSIVLISSSWALSNAGIGKADNLILTLNALNFGDSAHRPAVTFDEYHHGYGGSPGVTSLIDTPARLGLAQLAMAFVLLVFAVSRRFGRPVPLDEGTRQRSEYLASMSSLFRKAQATGLVKSELGRHFLKETAHTLGLPPNTDPQAIIQAAEQRYPDKAVELRRLIEAASASHENATDSEAYLLALARQWHRMRKELKKTK